jgi:hypothetical protein
MQERFDMFAAPGNSGHLFAAHGFDPHGTLPEAGYPFAEGRLVR